MKFKLILCMLFLGIFSKFTFCQEKKILPFYCQFKISDELKHSNTSFTDGFIFKSVKIVSLLKLDEAGKYFRH